MRYLIPEIENLPLEQLRQFANGCLALATVPGNMEKARYLCSTKPPSMCKADIEFALKILDREVVPDAERRRRDFLRG